MNSSSPKYFPFYGWIGLTLLFLFWILNWSLVGLRTHWGFFPLWLGYTIFVDAVVYSRKGTSLIARNLKLFISVDTGPLYMADAVGVPVVDIAGPADVDELYPLDKRCRIIQKKIYCVPCAHMFDVPRFCKEGHLRCLREITPQDVFAAAVSLINENIINL